MPHLLVGLPKPADWPKRTEAVLFPFVCLLRSGAKVAFHSMFNILSVVPSDFCLTLHGQRKLLVLGIHQNDTRKEKIKIEQKRKQERKKGRREGELQINP